ncbi:hypothetical protein KRX57_10795 [Weeksellaceae bacterium TAE3-ERU29]|nr:hypothetical protein [Weeksellaceae bacterium TAE3-ERU29]
MSKKPTPKKRIIVDFKKLNDKILSLLVEKFPDGYGDQDVIVFKNAKGETVEAVEVQTEDTVYLVKISQRLEIVMEEYEEDDDNDVFFDEEVTFEEPDLTITEE